jgi:hypothetical protein
MEGKDKTTTPGLMLAHAFAILGIAIIVRAALAFENAEEALAFYGVYHREPWNQFIHFFGVPGILWSMLVFLVHLKVPFVGELPMVQKLLLGYDLTYGLLTSLFYAVFYLVRTLLVYHVCLVRPLDATRSEKSRGCWQ